MLNPHPRCQKQHDCRTLPSEALCRRCRHDRSGYFDGAPEERRLYLKMGSKSAERDLRAAGWEIVRMRRGQAA